MNVPVSSTDNQIRVTVIGAGYLGITHAACMASLGFRVLAVEIDAAKVAELNAGHLPIYEAGLPELLRSGVTSGRLKFTTSYDEAALFGDVHFICIGTPQAPGRDQADLSQVTGAVTGLAQRLTRRCLIAGKSTVPVGTARQLATIVAQDAPQAEVAWNPEFLREGTAVADTLKPARIVAGVTSSWADGLLRHVYASLIVGGAGFFTTTLETAELSKVAANAFLATKITFINAMAEVCEAAGADARTLAQILGADPRIGGQYLRPGLGFGGGCLPKDIRAFAARAEELGAGRALSFLHEMDAINLRCRTRVVDLALMLADGNLTGIPMCLLGAAFKPGSDDVRDSPALDVAKILHGMGAQVTVYDPAALGNARQAWPDLGYAASAVEAAQDAQVVLLLTEWPEFAGLRPDDLNRVVGRRNIIDGRNVLDPAPWREQGWVYCAPGVVASDPTGPVTDAPGATEAVLEEQR